MPQDVRALSVSNEQGPTTEGPGFRRPISYFLRELVAMARHPSQKNRVDRTFITTNSWTHR